MISQLTIRVIRPWWFPAASAAALLWVRLGLPFDVDAFAAWLVRCMRLETVPSTRA